MPSHAVYYPDRESATEDDFYFAHDRVAILARQDGRNQAERTADMAEVMLAAMLRWHEYDFYRNRHLDYVSIYLAAADYEWNFLEQTKRAREAIEMAETTTGWGKEFVKDQAAGRWADVIADICEIDRSILDGAHHACPKHCHPNAGGKDRFRVFNDFEHSGGMFCNQCFNFKNGDGFAAIQWMTGMSFTEALEAVAESLGLDQSMRRTSFLRELAKQDQEEAAAENIWQVKDFIDLQSPSQKGPDRGRYVIEGMLREGEFGLMGAVSKGAKSWAVGNLVWATVTGGLWMGQECRQGRVLLIDTELPQRELDYRLSVIASEMHYQPKRGDVITVSLRGKTIDIEEIRSRLVDMKNKGQLDGVVLIVIDSIYKVMGGIDENQNGPVGQFVDTLIKIASEIASVFGVHHATKGSQSDKRALDVFSGAGAIGRSLDLSVIIRDHETPGLSVVDFDVRTSQPLPSVSAKFEWPLWHVVTTEPELKKSGGNKTDRTVIEREIVTAITDAGVPLSPSQLRKRNGRNPDTIESNARRMVKEGKLTIDESGKAPYFNVITPKDTQ